MADAISIEETNRIRVSLGMKPLPVPGSSGPVFLAESASSSDSEEASTLEKREAQGTANWQRLQDEAEHKRKKEARNEAIRKARDQAKRHEKLKGKGLGDADDDETDTKTWILQQKRRQKRIGEERARAKRMEEELRLREEQAYTAKDLAGIKVGHQASAFDDEVGEQILTLKDATIDEYDEEGDELENVELRENERRDERKDVLKRKLAYDPNADEDEGEDRTVLKQYDEVINGKKRKRFTLDADGIVPDTETRQERSGKSRKGQPISLDILKDVVTSDYQEPKEISFKKPKKSKKKSTRQRIPTDEDEQPTDKNETADMDSMEVDSTTAKPSRIVESFIDDDDLQASLARRRNAALKERKRISAKELAQQVQETSVEEPIEDKSDHETGLVIDETSEFVANLRPVEEEESQRHQRSRHYTPPKSSVKVESDEDVNMAESYNDVKDPTDADEMKPEAEKLTDTGLDADIQMNKGIGSTLNLLQQRGLVKKTDSGDMTANYRDRQRFLVEKQRREEAAELKARQQRERDRASGKLDRMSAREREDYARWENKQRDQLESRQLAEMFNKEYKPNVELRYVDEYGRAVGQKEAFKNLSHQFHGKGSGKQKTEKQLKKINEEKQKAAQNVLGTGQTTGLNNALGSAAKKQKQAGVRMG